MKPRVDRSTLFLVAGLVAHPALLVAAEVASPTPDATPRISFIDPDAPEVVEIRTLGERAINRLAMTMVDEVAVGVSKKGAEKALEECHLKTLPMVGGTVAGLPRIAAVKRTSLRLRDPANAPDAAETAALQRVEKDIERGKPPPILVQRIDRPGEAPEWRVYRPLGLLGQCVACHGPRENLGPEVQGKLRERYPADQAVGYAPGQWRGLIRVTIGEPPPKAAPAPAPKNAPEKMRKA